MTQTLDATYDGTVLHLLEPLNISPNSKVRVTVESIDDQQPRGFLKVAMALKLDGPEDWSENLEGYLYGTMPDHP
jgi:hypothetical protein